MKNILKEIIIDFQKEFKIDLIPRDIEVFESDKVHKAISVYGPRRSGKTSFLFLLINKLVTGSPDKIQDIVYINFENNKLSDLNAKDLDLVIESFKELYPDKQPILFLDEIQNIDGWSKWVRKLIDNKYKIYITGSNSKYLSKDIATELRGRTISYLLLPFSMKEYLNYKGLNFEKNDFYNSTAKSHFYNNFNRYLFYGGFPEISKLNNFESNLVLNEYLNTLVHKDIIERYNVKNIKVLRFLINYLLDNYSNILAINKIYNILKSLQMSTGKDIIYDYFEYIVESLFVFPVSKFSESLKVSEGYGKKYYLTDTGYINLGKQHFNEGRAFENLAYLEFLRKGYKINISSNRYECDFILSKDKNIYPVQVCCSLKSDITTYTREVNSLIETLKQLKVETGYILTKDESDNLEIDKHKIKVISAYEIFLNNL